MMFSAMLITLFSISACSTEKSAACDETEYAFVSENAPSEILCLPLSVCDETEYESQSPSYSSDRECLTISNCQPGEAETEAPTPTSDRSCAPCALGETYSSSENALECTPVTDCLASEYIATPATPTTDLVCGDCQIDISIENGDCLACIDTNTCLTLDCDQGFVAANGDCRPAPTPANADCTPDDSGMACQCTLGHFGLLEWNTEFDIWDGDCTPWSDCQPGSHVLEAGSHTTDRICESCTEGIDFSTEINAADCLLLTDCQPGETIAAEPTISSDRSCQPCLAGESFSTEVNASVCTPVTDCIPGEHVLVTPTTTSDRSCNSCTSGIDFSVSENAPFCSPLTTCAPGQFVSTPPNAAADRSCGDCSLGIDYSANTNAQECTPLTDCQPGEYVVDVPTLSTNRICDNCAIGIEFSNALNALECTATTDCQPGEYVLQAASLSADRICDSCTADQNHSTESNAAFCQPLTDCLPGEYEVDAPTLSTNRSCDSCAMGIDFSTGLNATECTPISDCGPGDYISAMPTLMSDRICEPCSVGIDYASQHNATECTPLTDCQPGQYISCEATLSTDRSCGDCIAGIHFSTGLNAADCTPVTNCLAGEYVLSEPAPNSDRNCQACTLGIDFANTENALECEPLTDCLPGEYISSPASTATDRYCSPCAEGLNYSQGPNATNCESVTDCQPGEYVFAEPTSSSDRICMPCSLGSTYSIGVNESDCTSVQICADNAYETATPTLSQDRACAVLNVSVNAVDDRLYEGGLVPGLIRVSLSAIQAVDTEINFTVGGSAERDEDYALTLNGVELENPLIIPAGQQSVDIDVSPLATPGLEVEESIVFGLEPSLFFELGVDFVTLSVVEYGPSTGTVYVVADNGDDANAGDETAPFATIEHAVTQLAAGDTLYIKDGTYTNSGHSDSHGPNGDNNINNDLLARITASGTPDNWITIAAYPDGNNVRPLLKFDGLGGIQIHSGANYIRIEGLEIKGPNQEITYDWAHEHRWSKEHFYTGRGIYSWGPVHHIVVENCKVHHTPGSGIRFNKADYILVQGNTVANTTWWSTSAESAIVIATAESIDTQNVVKFLYSGNVVYNNWNFMEFCNTPLANSTADEYGNCDYYSGGIIDGQGLYVTRNNATYLHGRMRFENNIAFNNGFGGVVYHKTDRGELVNNLVFQNGAYPGISNYTGMTVNTADDLLIANNVIWARDGNDYGLKNNGNASNVVASHNYVVGLSQFGSGQDNTFISFSQADNLEDLFEHVVDISISHPNPHASSGDFAPANIDTWVQGYDLDFHPLESALELIDMGDPSPAPAVDFDGVPRPQGIGVDIGPFELE